MTLTDIDNTVITIPHNYWRVPSVDDALSGVLEGCPSHEQQQHAISDAVAARAAWKPSAEGMQLVEQLKAFVGSRVQIQFWDSIMFWLEEEGPFPAEADCVGVTLLQDGDFLQAYLLVRNVKEIPNRDGYSPNCFFQQRADCHYMHASLADVYSVAKMGVPQPC